MPSTGITKPFALDIWGSRSKAGHPDHFGPSSYPTGGEPLSQSQFGGPNPFGLANYKFISGGLSNSGNYRVDTLYGGIGDRTKVFLKWSYASPSVMGVDGVTGTGGSGMTPGTYALAFAGGGGGSGAAGTITVTAGAITAITITNPGTGYISVPTVTAATGGTPPTLTATVGSMIGSEVQAGTNLSAESIRLLVLGG